MDCNRKLVNSVLPCSLLEYGFVLTRRPEASSRALLILSLVMQWSGRGVRYALSSFSAYMYIFGMMPLLFSFVFERPTSLQGRIRPDERMRMASEKDDAHMVLT